MPEILTQEKYSENEEKAILLHLLNDRLKHVAIDRLEFYLGTDQRLIMKPVEKV
jgi:hypothetical protein